jgi:DNA-binding beta-propeller fold protein YncE
VSIAAGVRNDRGTKLGISLIAFCFAAVIGLTSLGAREGILAVTRVGRSPVAVTIDPAANEAFVVNKGSQEVTVLDLQTHEIKIRYAVGPLPEAIAFNPQTRTIVVTSPTGKVTTINRASGSISDTLSVGKAPARVAIDVEKNAALVTDFDGASLHVVDLATQKVTATIGLKNGALGIALLMDKRRAVVACQYDMELLQVNLDSNAVDKEFLVGRYVSEVAVNPATGRVVFVDPSSNGILAVYLPDENLVASTLPIGPGPQSVAVYAKRNVALVSEFNGNRVLLVDLEKNILIRTIRVAKGPMGLAIHPETGIAVVANRLADSVTFLDLEAILNSAPGVSAAPAAKSSAPVVP